MQFYVNALKCEQKLYRQRNGFEQFASADDYIFNEYIFYSFVKQNQCRLEQFSIGGTREYFIMLKM